MEAQRILVVDDDSLQAWFLEGCLRDSGYEVVGCVSSGQEAVSLALDREPDLILMDIVLGGDMDGIEAATHIRAKTDVPIIYLSAHSDTDIVRRAKLSGPFGYLVKPCSVSELCAAVEVALHKASLERALKESEARYRAVVEDQTDAICRFRANNVLTFANTAYLEQFGVDCQSLDGRPPFLDADDDKGVDGLLVGLTPESPVTRLSRKVVSLGGALRWYDWTIRALFDDRGVVGELQAVGRDVTDRERSEEARRVSHEELERHVRERTADLEGINLKLENETTARMIVEEALRDSEERFRTIVDSAADCVFIKDLNGRYTFANPALSRLLNLPVPQILGKTDEELFGAETASRMKEVDRRVLENGRIEEELSLAIRGHRVVLLITSFGMRRGGGQLDGVCGIARNITGRKQAPTTPATELPECTSEAMKRALSLSLLAAQSETIVMLRGESGSGKDYLARYIHTRSRTAAGPFYSINCATVPTNLAESELFGYEDGAFTGARGAKQGLLELAEGGTLLLNEVGDLPSRVQAKLLSFLDSFSFVRVGGHRAVSVRCRLMTATNRDLEKEVKEGRFREDLYYRINVFSIPVPPLRERLEDIPVLVTEILNELAAEMPFRVMPRVGRKVMAELTNYSWPGNVRELRNALERALILSRGKGIRSEHLRLRVQSEPTLLLDGLFENALPLPDVVAEIQRRMIRRALDRSSNSLSEAAKLLGISRFALSRLIRKLASEQRTSAPPTP